MQTEKAEKISISGRPALVAVIDAHEPNRSAYFVRLAEEDLRKRGILPSSSSSEEADALREARDVMQLLGAGPFRERLRSLVAAGTVG